MLDIKIEHNLPDFAEALKKLKTRAFPKAVRMALNKAILSVRAESSRSFRQQRKLKAGDVNKKYTSIAKATGNSVETMEAVMKISGKSLSLINFVKGDKSPRSQKGIKIRKRKPIRVEVMPGHSGTRNKLFIAKGASGNVHVFRRVGGTTSTGKGKLMKQNAAGLAQIFSRDKFFRPIDLFASKTFNKEFGRAFAFELSKIG